MKTILKEFKLTYLLLQRVLLGAMYGSQGEERKKYKLMIDEAGEVYKTTMEKLKANSSLLGADKQ